MIVDISTRTKRNEGLRVVSLWAYHSSHFSTPLDSTSITSSHSPILLKLNYSQLGSWVLRRQVCLCEGFEMRQSSWEWRVHPPIVQSCRECRVHPPIIKYRVTGAFTDKYLISLHMKNFIAQLLTFVSLYVYTTWPTHPIFCQELGSVVSRLVVYIWNLLSCGPKEGDEHHGASARLLPSHATRPWHLVNIIQPDNCPRTAPL